LAEFISKSIRALNLMKNFYNFKTRKFETFIGPETKKQRERREFVYINMRNIKAPKNIFRSIKGWEKYDAKQEEIERKKKSKKRDNFVNGKP